MQPRQRASGESLCSHGNLDPSWDLSPADAGGRLRLRWNVLVPISVNYRRVFEQGT